MRTPRLSKRWATAAASTAVVAAAVAGTAIGVRAWAAPTTAPSADPTVAPTVVPAPSAGRSDRLGRRDRSSAAATPAAPPATLPAMPTKPLPMSAAYAVVNYRSIFIKGNQAITREPPPPPPGSGTHIQKPPTRPEELIVFNGVLMVDGQPEALVEDTSARKSMAVKVGDPLATGRVTGVTFDSLDYQAKGSVVIHVSLGQNLDGHAAAPGDTAAPTLGAPSATATGGPSGAGPTTAPAGAESTAGLSTDDILARMRKKRQLELQGGK
jgi:hypothetical protein